MNPPPSARTLLEERLVARAANGKSSPTIARIDRDQPMSLSFGEQRLWFADQVEPDAAAYTLTSLLRWRGRLDIASLDRALQRLVQRHESLRTRFISVDGAPRRIIQQQVRLPLKVVDLAPQTPAAGESALRGHVRDERRRGFNLGTGPLIRLTLVRLEPGEHVLIVAMHHIVADAWSVRVFERELAALYRECAGGQSANLPEPTLDYADFAAWQAQQLSGEAFSARLAAQLQTLEGAPTVLQLPTDRPRPSVRTAAGATFQARAPRELAGMVRSLGEQLGATPFMILLAAFQALLARLATRTDFLVGAPAAGRVRPELEGVVGFFVNTLVLRADVSGDPSFVELLQRVREGCLNAYAHQDVPFERLVAGLRVERDASRNPLVQVMFALEPGPGTPTELPGLTIEPVTGHADSGLAKFELTLFVSLDDSHMDLAFEYNTDLFDAATIERFNGYYCALLQAMFAEPNRPLSTPPMLSDAELSQQLVVWNNTQTDFPIELTVNDLVAEQALRTPMAIAVAGLSGAEQLTYLELERRANGLAHRLRELGVERGERVGVCMERSPLLIVCLLAILKSGAAYVPLDPAQPFDRLQRMLEDARPRALIVESGTDGAHGLDGRAVGAEVVRVDRALETLPGRPDPPLVEGKEGSDPAYVMYTSGSSGVPKGVVVPHRGITRLVINSNYLELLASDTVAQASNASFDAATFEIWGALTHGARLVVVPIEVLLSPRTLAETMNRERISVLLLTTALFNEVARLRPNAFATLRALLFGGEAANPEAARQVLDAGPPARLLNVYGPTETTTMATWYAVEHVEVGAKTLPIGRPLANTQVYVLDSASQPVPIGVSGELYIGGPGVALGYLNQPELTREKFVADPFTPGDNARLYRTGDMVRYRSDGALEFLGRGDDQIKLRGFRIEPAEIEARLMEHPAIHQALVTVREAASGDKQLVGYVAVSPGHAHLETDVRRFLRERLPGYMLPTGLVLLDSLPLTPNGKVDRHALLALGPAPALDTTERRHPPEDETQALVAGIWTELLGHDGFDIEDDFFEVGGHSLMAARVVARIEQMCGRRLPLSAFLGRVTVASIASLIRDHQQPVEWPCLVPIQVGDGRAPLFGIHGAFGDVLCFAELARELGPEQPVYGLQAVGLDGIQLPLARVEDMASRYISELRAVQPHGPFYLLGFSGGGTIAFEMAQQLNNAGERVALLGIVDNPSDAIAYGRPAWSLAWAVRAAANIWRNLPYWLGLMTASSWRASIRTAANGFEHLVRTRRLFEPRDGASAALDFRERCAQILGAGSEAWPAFRWHVTEAQYTALRAYVPSAYAGVITVLRASRQPFLSSLAPDLGWSALASQGAVVRTILGGHHTLLARPYVRGVARALEVYLAEAASQAA